MLSWEAEFTCKIAQDDCHLGQLGGVLSTTQDDMNLAKVPNVFLGAVLKDALRTIRSIILAL